MGKALPKTFGKYLLERRLGVGGMAETFVARREGSGDIEQRLCLKRVLPAFNEDASFRRLFQREARLAATLRHSNIVGTLDFGSVGQVQYMALELVEGVDLRDLLRSQPNARLPAETMTFIVFELAHALEYAHAPREGTGGIIHRDVTPSNVLLSIEGGVKLADFGVAKALGGTATMATATGVMKGKMPYMPPEQMMGSDVDGRVDLFALGVLFYEGLAGRRPFVGAHDVEVMSKIVSNDRPPLQSLCPDLPEGLIGVVESLLATDRAERMPTAAALIDALCPFVPGAQHRSVLANVVRAAYGAARHGGKESDTELVVQAGVDPLGDTKRSGRKNNATMLIGSPETGDDIEAPTLTHTLEHPAAAALGTTVGDRSHERGARDELGELAPAAPSARGPRLPTAATARAAVSTTAPTTRRSGTGRLWAALVGVLVVSAAAFFIVGGMGSSETNMPSTATETPRAETLSPIVAEQVEPPEAEAEPVSPGEAPAGLDEPSGMSVPTPRASMRTSMGIRPRHGMSAAQPDDVLPENGPSLESEMSAITNEEVAEMVEHSTPPNMSSSMGVSRTRVRITVLPWGNVWIDGQYVGRAPQTVSLQPGPHRFAGGQDAPAEERRVRIRETDQVVRVSLDLSR